MEASSTQSTAIRFGKISGLGARLKSSIKAAQQFLFAKQHEDGWWCGELEADTTLESDYIFLHTVLGTRDERRFQQCADEILRHQNEDGGWPIYQDGPSNVTAAVKAYFALKMCGYSPDDPRMAKARERILAMGGVPACNTFSKVYLCALGQYDYDAVPAIPPELVLFPNWFWFNIYEISSWSRAILIPLSICYAKKPFKKIPDEWNIDELFPNGRHGDSLRLKWDSKLISWRNFFLVLDRLCHAFERVHVRPLRSVALKAAEKWMLERFELSDGLGAIYPSILNSIIAMRCLGYSLDDPQVIRALDEFEKLGIAEGDNFRMQPCVSPVWDTAYSLFALAESGVDAHDPRMVKAAEWMLKKQIRRKGDWAIKVPNAEPGGWYFEHNNEFYPDVDDTAQVLLALNHIETADSRFQSESVQRGIDWELAMQCKNGGWASFDKDNNRMVFQYVPFADHNAMLDPATVDITGRVLEALAVHGFTPKDKPVQRAIEFIRKEQEPDGSWFGRWGVNYIYGTMCVLRGLEAVGFDNHDAMVQQATEWLRMMQNSDGGWGESIASYDDENEKGVGVSTSSQTAWAVLGLMAGGDYRSESLARGIAYLLDHQEADGGWSEVPYTGTGFPRVFYLKYHSYPWYFPLMALAKYSQNEVQGA
ncbi:MAG TPA: squalene--hopene cyclase [Candidatus Saccharimonadales bacterium]|nr:squalene--hopene cyclase [Candidatus Saccharimonadales bacterium]